MRVVSSATTGARARVDRTWMRADGARAGIADPEAARARAFADTPQGRAGERTGTVPTAGQPHRRVACLRPRDKGAPHGVCQAGSTTTPHRSHASVHAVSAQQPTIHTEHTCENHMVCSGTAAEGRAHLLGVDREAAAFLVAEHIVARLHPDGRAREGRAKDRHNLLQLLKPSNWPYQGACLRPGRARSCTSTSSWRLALAAAAGAPLQKLSPGTSAPRRRASPRGCWWRTPHAAR